MCQIVGTPIANFQPVYLNPNSAYRDHFPPVCLTIDKFIKSSLVQVQATLSTVHSTYKGVTLKTLPALKEACNQVLDQAELQPRSKDKQLLSNELKQLINPNELDLGILLLKNLKRELIQVLIKEYSDPETINKSIESIFECLASQQQINAEWIGKVNQFNSKIHEKTHKLFNKIISFDAHKRPSREMLDSLYLRTSGAFNRAYFESELDRTEIKHKSREERFSMLSTEWNKLVVKLTEVQTFDTAIQMIKDNISNLVQIRQKLEVVKEELEQKQNALCCCECFLDQEYDSKTKPANTSNSEISRIKTACEKLGKWNDINIGLEKLTQDVQQVEPPLIDALCALKQFKDKEDFDLKSVNLMPESNKLLFTKAHQNKVDSFQGLIIELNTVWTKLKQDLKKTQLKHELLFSISKFVSDLTFALSGNVTHAATLRNLRKSAEDFTSYETAHSNANLQWDTFCTQITWLLAQFADINNKFTGANNLEHTTETKEKDKKDMLLLTEDQILKQHQAKVKKLLSALNRYLNIRLSTVNKALALELNRGASALQLKKTYVNNFKDAFALETFFTITDKTTAMLPKILTSWTAPQENAPRYYQSPYDALN